MRARLLIPLAVALLSTALPAAAEGEVVANYALLYRPAGSGYIVILQCEALAAPQRDLDLPLVTTVHCKLGTQTSTLSMPGAAAETAVASPLTLPFEICVNAASIFLTPLMTRLYAVTDSQCTTITEL